MHTRLHAPSEVALHAPSEVALHAPSEVALYAPDGLIDTQSLGLTNLYDTTAYTIGYSNVGVFLGPLDGTWQ